MDVKAQNRKYKLQNSWRAQTVGWEKVPPLGLLQVPTVPFCTFLMKHSSCPKAFLLWLQHSQSQGRWDSRSSAPWLWRFEIRAWNGERGMALSLCSVFRVPTPAAAPDAPLREKIRWILSILGPSGQKYKMNFKYFGALSHRVQQRWGKAQLAQQSQEDISKWWGGLLNRGATEGTVFAQPQWDYFVQLKKAV